MKVRISPITYLFYAIVLLFCHDVVIIASLTAVVIHEAGHLIVIVLCSCTIECIDITPLGMTIRRTGLTGHLQDVAIHLAGPTINIVIALVWMLCQNADSYTVTANLFFGLLNLLPIDSLDGGKVLYALLACRFNERSARLISQALSFFFLFLLWLLAVSDLLMLNGTPSLLFFCVGLFSSIIKDDNGI